MVHFLCFQSYRLWFLCPAVCRLTVIYRGWVLALAKPAWVASGHLAIWFAYRYFVWCLWRIKLFQFIAPVYWRRNFTLSFVSLAALFIEFLGSRFIHLIIFTAR